MVLVKVVKIAGAALIGGETAEMPGMYSQGDYDLAGFCVGIVEKECIIDGTACQIGDKLIGIASSGPHSNGYSLIRKILEMNRLSLCNPFHQTTIGDHLIEPTRIYVKPILALLQDISVHAIAHITGGGITENLPRVVPENIKAIIDLSAWETPPIFTWLQQQGDINEAEMLGTFNCGIGMIVCVSSEDEEVALKKLRESGEKVFTIGSLAQADKGAKVTYR